MVIEWDIQKTEQPGGGWLVRRKVMREVVRGNPDEPDTVSVHRHVDSIRHQAYTTLTNARRSIAAELRLDKRVRFRKDTDTHYTYTYTPST